MTLEEKYKHEMYLAKRDGRAEGRAEGESRLSMLVQQLLKTDRMDDLQRVTEDSEYRLKLFEEFGL